MIEVRLDNLGSCDTGFSPQTPPLGLTFTCLLAAVPGSLVAAPFSMVLLAAFVTQVGALQTAPVLIAVVTAFLTMESVKYLLVTRRKGDARTGTAGDG